MKIRRLDAERDLDGYLALMHQAVRFPRTRAEWWERQRLAGPDAFRRFLVGEIEGRVVAAASLLDSDMATNGVVAGVVVDASVRRRGHGRGMADALEELLADRVPAPDAVEARVRDDDAASRDWAERRGFRVRNHAIRSRLDLTRFDAGEHRAAVERVEGAGLRIETPDDAGRLYDLYAILLRDAPDRLEPPSRAWFDRMRAEHPEAIHLVAVDGVAWVGLAVASTTADGGAWNDFTGVAPGHRGRGIARALKVAVAERLAARGGRWIEASNNALNGPMLAVNRALGYQRVAGFLWLRRALR